jgi:hypothetical protein
VKIAKEAFFLLICSVCALRCLVLLEACHGLCFLWQSGRSWMFCLRKFSISVASLVFVEFRPPPLSLGPSASSSWLLSAVGLFLFSGLVLSVTNSCAWLSVSVFCSRSCGRAQVVFAELRVKRQEFSEELCFVS